MLGEMAARDPSPELRMALPVLNRLARSFWGGREAKDIYLTAAQQIDAATAALKDLPLPSAQPASTAEGLPLPSDAPSLGTDTLPLPAESGVVPADYRPPVIAWWQRLWRRLGR